jgi:hypothetical protein
VSARMVSFARRGEGSDRTMAAAFTARILGYLTPNEFAAEEQGQRPAVRAGAAVCGASAPARCSTVPQDKCKQG